MELVELKTVRNILKVDIAFTVILITGSQRITNNKIESQLKRTGALRHTIICGAPVVNEKLSCFFPQSFPDLPLRESECRGELFEFLLLPGGEKGVQA